MIDFLKTVFSGGGVVKAIENVALEAIETDMESAEAKSLMVKTLDPNGVMRRNLANFASKAYGYYLIVTSVLIGMHFFGIGDPDASLEAMNAITDLFLPITTAWGTIVTAAFGVNGVNSWKGR